jgi:formamidopyrimidine-DNA glycosylase
MPEAPEVQTVLNTLEDGIKDLKIEKAIMRWPKTVSNMETEEFCRLLEGEHVRRFLRHGKYLVLETDSYDWIVHLRMEGKLYLSDLPAEELEQKKHIHASFLLENGKWLHFQDTRKFGRMQLYPKTVPYTDLPCFDKTGPDALDESYLPEAFYQKLHRSKKPVKTLLLDQSVIAGIGNIYADEILFASKIHPETPANQITLKQAETLLENTREILKKALEAKGTTIRSFTSGNHQPGSFQNFLKVHTREGKPCPICQNPIGKIKTGGRSTYYCPHCQKKQEPES